MKIFSQNLIKCPICGGFYELFTAYVGNQDYCPDCRAMLIRKINNPTPEEELERARKRQDFFK